MSFIRSRSWYFVLPVSVISLWQMLFMVLQQMKPKRCSWTLFVLEKWTASFWRMIWTSRADWERSCRNMKHQQRWQWALRTCKTRCTWLMHFVSCHGPQHSSIAISCNIMQQSLVLRHIMIWNERFQLPEPAVALQRAFQVWICLSLKTRQVGRIHTDSMRVSGVEQNNT